MLETLITSKIRIKFFYYNNNQDWLRSLMAGFGELANVIRLELNRFEKKKLFKTNRQGNKKVHQANNYRLPFPNINLLLMKCVCLDKIIDKVVNVFGSIDTIYLVSKPVKVNNSEILGFF